jgi:hypothetical protein
MTKINLRGALAGLLIGASALTSGCATTPRTIGYVKGNLLDRTMVSSTNDCFIVNGVRVPAEGAKSGLYMVFKSNLTKTSPLHDFTEGYIVTGRDHNINQVYNGANTSNTTALVFSHPSADGKNTTPAYISTILSINGEPIKKHSVLETPLNMDKGQCEIYVKDPLDNVLIKYGIISH